MKFFYQWLDTIARDKRVQPAAFKVAYILARKADDNGHAWPNQEVIKDESALSDNGVRKAIRQLVGFGIIEVQQVIAGNKLPSGFTTSRTRFVYTLKTQLSPAQSSGEQSSGEQSSGEQSAVAPLHRVRSSPAQSAGPCRENYKENYQLRDIKSENPDQLTLIPSNSPARKTGKPRARDDAHVQAIASRYLEIFNGVFNRRSGIASLSAKKIGKRLADGFEDWQILCAPILQFAMDPNTAKVRHFGPNMLLCDGKHPRRSENGATYGAIDWLERIYNVADTLTLDQRLTAIAKHYGLTEDIKRTGARLTGTGVVHEG